MKLEGKYLRFSIHKPVVSIALLGIVIKSNPSQAWHLTGVFQ